MALLTGAGGLETEQPTMIMLRYSRQQFVIPTFIVLMLVLMLTAAHASPMLQSEQISIGEIVYERQSLEGGVEIVVRNASGIRTFPISSEQCGSPSPLGNYVAMSNRNAPTELHIYRVALEQLLMTIPWQSSWRTCSFYWISDIVLGFVGTQTTSDAAEVFTLDISTGLVSPSAFFPNPRRRVSDGEGELPNLIPGDVSLVAPNGTTFVYNRCLSGLVGQSSLMNPICAQGGEVIIFDTVSNEIVTILTDTNASATESVGGASWSTNSRYLVYQPVYGPGDAVPPPLQVYDVVANQFVDTSSTLGFQVAEAKGFRWSPDSSRLAFWLLDQTTPSDPTYHKLGSLNLTSGVVEVGNSSYLLPLESFFWSWSPANDAIAYINSVRELRIVNITSGIEVVVDSDVLTLIAWKAEITPPATATSTPSGTPV